MYLIVMLVYVCLDLCLQTIIILEKCPTALMKIIASSDSSETGRLGQEIRKNAYFLPTVRYITVLYYLLKKQSNFSKRTWKTSIHGISRVHAD